MTTDPSKFIANSGLAGLGSFGNIVGSFSVASQSIPTSSVYQHPEQSFAVSESEFLATTLFNLSFETQWRTLERFTEYAFDTSNNFYYAGTTVADSTAKFSIYINQAYKSGLLSVSIIMANRSSITNPISTPAFTFSIKSYVYKDPFAL